jgi:hypothetical protein
VDGHLLAPYVLAVFLAMIERPSAPYAYLRGAVTNLVNPKSVTFVVAFLPQFVDRGLGHVPAPGRSWSRWRGGWPSSSGSGASSGSGPPVRPAAVRATAVPPWDRAALAERVRCRPRRSCGVGRHVLQVHADAQRADWTAGHALICDVPGGAP